MKQTMLAVLVLGSTAAAALAQVSAGPAFQVNSYTTDNQSISNLALDGRGAFVVVWQSYRQDGSGPGVFGQRYSDMGAALGSEFRVNTYTTSFQSQPVVGAALDGGFMVLWTSFGLDGDPDGVGIAAQRFDAGGNRIGGEFRVNDYTTSYQERPSIEPGARGEFVVAWQGGQQDGQHLGIFGRRLDAAGARLGDEFQVNTYSTNSQGAPSVASSPDGQFLVAWMSLFQDGSSFGIFGQRFDGAGRPVGGEFQVNTHTTLSQSFPAATLAADGTFVVTWTSDDPDGSYLAVFAQRFAASGSRLGAQFRVDDTEDTAAFPSVAAAADGSFVVVWEGVGGPGDPDIGIFGRRFTAAGVPRGAEFRVNAYVTDYQTDPHVVSDPHGNFVVAWQSFGQDGSGNGVFAQRFGGLRPAALAVDSTGNRVLEPGETVAVTPSWRNVNGATQAFGGTLSGITGPAGATHTITDGAADYGAVANGATAGCSDCYAVSVSNPPSRPALHWDAATTERIVPGAHGQNEKWVLHVGGSFTDVPSTSAFYRFVETLLHHSVTAGCSATQYCPGSSTTRAQMAVFALVSKEGHGYAPPPCTTPVFGDVPASNPFCPFIEELARRGVVSGCGGGNYCPANAVTREQMAVFVLRTVDPAVDPPDCAPPNRFTDVPETSPFCRWIEELANRGVVTGCAADLYCPTEPVTREQMAVFIGATFGLTLYGP